ncbi:MAG: hypothetical protein R2825_26110 [Saprospiraceae bacterium]
MILAIKTSTSETKVFNTYNGTIEICPLGTAPGSLSVQATTLSDANCSCL